MTLTAIVCCRPMSERDIFLTRAAGHSVFAASARQLVRQKCIDRVVLALAADVPMPIVDSLRADGFDVLVDANKAPQRRILNAMQQLGLSNALILNGYSFLLDESIVTRLTNQWVAGYNLAAFVSKTPFSYACLLDLEACREIAEHEQLPLPPNRLHCHCRTPGSRVHTCLVRPEAEYEPLDDCFWLLALNALHGGSDRLLTEMVDLMTMGTMPPRQALHHVLCGQGVDLPALVARYDAKSVHLYFKNRREVEYTWLSLLHNNGAAEGTFLEVGSGQSPYLSHLFARHFTQGICFDPFIPRYTPLFNDRLSIASELNQRLGNHLLSRGAEPGSLEYHESDLLKLGLDRASVDFCYSRSVLEHVEDLEGMAVELRRIMRPGSIMLHAVDFTAHDERRDDNIYPFYAYAKDWWLANKPFLINLLRLPDMTKIFSAAGFDVQVLQRNLDSRLPPQLHPNWREYSRDDLICGGAFLRCAMPG